MAISVVLSESGPLKMSATGLKYLLIDMGNALLTSVPLLDYGTIDEVKHILSNLTDLGDGVWGYFDEAIFYSTTGKVYTWADTDPTDRENSSMISTINNATLPTVGGAQVVDIPNSTVYTIYLVSNKEFAIEDSSWWETT